LVARTSLSAILPFAVAVSACKPERVVSSAGSDSGKGLEHCQVLRQQVCAQFGKTSEECRLAEKQVQGFAEDRCLAMLSRYDELARSAARLVEGRKALSARAHNTLHGPAPSLGNPDARVTMVLFCDFDSPDCARGSGIAAAIKNLYGDKVRLVFRQFPLSGNKDAHLAAQASLAAHAQGKFWAYYDIMFGNERDHSRPALERYAKEAGLDLVAFGRALDRQEFVADVDADRELGRKLDVRVLPALFLDGKQVRFPYGVTELADLVSMGERTQAKAR
jgi:predicted DsbA family dithiol-disulfide isomerase